MKTKKRTSTICSRGHKFYKSSDCPVCPICWPGRLKNKRRTAKKSTRHTHYHKDGSVWAKGSIKGVKMHGSWVWFRKDGTKMRSGHFDSGKQVGEWVTYDKKGKPYKVTQIKN